MASDPDSCELTTDTLITVLLDERVMTALTSVISRAINEALHKPTAVDKPDSRDTTTDDKPKTDFLTEELPSMTSQSTHAIHKLTDELHTLCKLRLPAEGTQDKTSQFTSSAYHCRRVIQREEVYK